MVPCYAVESVSSLRPPHFITQNLKDSCLRRIFGYHKLPNPYVQAFFEFLCDFL